MLTVSVYLNNIFNYIYFSVLSHFTFSTLTCFGLTRAEQFGRKSMYLLQQNDVSGLLVAPNLNTHKPQV
jgi:hypothetical protein